MFRGADEPRFSTLAITASKYFTTVRSRLTSSPKTPTSLVAASCANGLWQEKRLSLLLPSVIFCSFLRGSCGISRPYRLWPYSCVSVYNGLWQKQNYRLWRYVGVFDARSFFAVRFCDGRILGCRAGGMRKETTLCTCQVLMLFA